VSSLTREEIELIIKNKISDALEVRVGFDGSKAHIIVVLEAFASMPRIKKQQLVYSALSSQIADGSIHAVTMETLSPEEWDKVKHFR
jgi:acid stress-induced BolA-like protein IbaG/YrbA